MTTTKPEPTLADAGPDYVERAFPRGDFPVYDWTERPAGLPPVVWTTETTHRDGQQGGLPLTTAQSIQLYEMMCAFTGSSGAVRQAEFFVYRPADRDALTGALERWKNGAPVEPTTWIRATAKDVALIRSLGVRETGMLASISDYHTFHKFTPGGRRAAVEHYLAAVRTTLDAGIRPRLHLEDATRAPLDVISWFVEAVQALAASYPAALRPKFRVCDTMGVGLPYDDVAAPRSVPKIFSRLRTQGLAPEDLEFHPHNDTWMIVPNCLAALRAGCGAINGTLLGKGERTGNAPLEGVLLHLIGMGYFQENRPDFTALNPLAAFYEEIGHGVPPKYPLYGRDAHRTRAGIHADGLNKFWWMYAPFDVPKLLGRPLEVSLTKDSGLAGVIFLLRQHRQLDLAKDDPRVQRIQEWVLRQFDEGRQTSIEWEELAPVADRLLAAAAA
ncbi:MAG: pyruvate carboxyltransferase [Verrucomicrobia bacterium]|nr:pyruvate carboxyltransferase [Verrucomicrobiota bacterium]